MSVGTELPRYRSHKTVWALKIASIELADEDGSANIIPAEAGYVRVHVDAAYMQKHKPQVGGYYIVYAGGYASWSPAEAFEEGYTRE